MALQKAKRFKWYCKKVSRHLVCTLCLELAKTPVKQCFEGHICCSNCVEYIINCPKCKSPFIYKNVIINKIVNTFGKTFCPFKNNGCLKVLSTMAYDYHIENCSYRQIKCKICFQQVFFYYFRVHTFNEHPGSLWMKEKNWLSWKNFDFDKNTVKTEVVQAFDQLFWCCFNYNIKLKSFNIVVQFIGPRYKAVKYQYEVGSMPSQDGSRISLKRPTQYYMGATAYKDGFSITKDTMIELSQNNTFILYLNMLQEKKKFH